MKNNILLTSAFALVLTSCGGGGSSSSPDTTTISGQASDGYLSGATVFLDLDGDRIHDSNEPSTTTSNDGSYSLPYDNSLSGNIVVTGGIDIATGNAFNATLEAPLSGTEVHINPISNLVAKKVRISAESVESARAAIAQSLGLNTNDIVKDPISEQSQNGNNSIIAAALGVQKTIEDLANAAQAADSNLNLSSVIDDIATNLAIETDASNSFDELIERAVSSTKTGAITLPLAVKNSTDNAKKRFNAVKTLVSQVANNTGSTATTAISNIQKLVERDIDFAREQIYENANFVTGDTNTFAIDIKVATNTALSNLIDDNFIENKVAEIVIEAKTGSTDTAFINAIKLLDSFDIDNLIGDEFIEELRLIVEGDIVIAGINTTTLAVLVTQLEEDRQEELNEEESENTGSNFTFPSGDLVWWDALNLDYANNKAYITKTYLRSSDSKMVWTDKEYSVNSGTTSFTTEGNGGSPTFTWDETAETWVDSHTGMTYQIIDNVLHLNNGDTAYINYLNDISGDSLYYNGVRIAQMPSGYNSIEGDEGSIKYNATHIAEDVLYVKKVFAESNPYGSLNSFINRRCAHLDKAVRKYDSDNDGINDIAITFVSNGTLTSNIASDGQICGYENGTQTGAVALYQLDSSGDSMIEIIDSNFGSWERTTKRNKDIIVVRPNQVFNNDDFDNEEHGCNKDPIFSIKKLNASTDTMVVWSGNLVNCNASFQMYNPVAAKAIRGKTKARLNGIYATSSEDGFVFTSNMLAGKTFYNVEKIDTADYQVFSYTFNANATSFTATDPDEGNSTYSVTLDNFILADDNAGDRFHIIPISKKADSSGNVQYYKIAFQESNGSMFEVRMFDSLVKAQAYANAKNYRVKPIAGEEVFAFGEGDFAFNNNGTTTFYSLIETDNDQTNETGYERGKWEVNSATSTIAYTDLDGSSGLDGSDDSGNYNYSITNGIISIDGEDFRPVGFKVISTSDGNITYYRSATIDTSDNELSIDYFFTNESDMNSYYNYINEN